MGMPFFQRPLVDSQGNLKPFAQLLITRESDGGAQSIYSDRDGSSLLSNAGLFTDEGDGISGFYLPPDLYKMILTAGGISTTWRYVHIPPLKETLIESTTSRTATIKDVGNLIVCTNGSAINYEIDDDLLFKDQEIELRQSGAGQITIVPGTGMTVEPPSGGTLVTHGEGATVLLKKIDNAGSYILVGHTVAAE